MRYLIAVVLIVVGLCGNAFAWMETQYNSDGTTSQTYGNGSMSTTYNSDGTSSSQFYN